MKNILIKGPVLSQSGYGEQARFAMRALLSRPDLYNIFIEPINWGKTGWIVNDSEEKDLIDQLIGKTIFHENSGQKYDAVIQVTIPNEWEKLAPVNIGYTAGIETTKVAPGWVEKGNIMDRIILVSNHSKDIYQKTAFTIRDKRNNEVLDDDYRCKTPMDVVNFPVKEIQPADVPIELEHDFNFLSVAQWGPRKNIKNTIKWFVEEFKDRPVGLVLKLNVMNNSTIDYHHSIKKIQELLRDYEDRKCKIYLLHGDLTPAEMAGLYKHKKIKALINISHGEGFGLPIFEAAYSGLPIVTVGWSGQVDYLYAPYHDKKKNKTKIRPHFASVEYDINQIQQEAVWDGVLERDSGWCFAKKMSYKNKIKDVYSNYKKYKDLANSLKTHVLKEHSKEKAYSNFVTSVSQCFERTDEEENVEVMVL